LHVFATAVVDLFELGVVVTGLAVNQRLLLLEGKVGVLGLIGVQFGFALFHGSGDEFGGGEEIHHAFFLVSHDIIISIVTLAKNTLLVLWRISS
jgi:hypothetical protein